MHVSLNVALALTVLDLGALLAYSHQAWTQFAWELPHLSSW